MKKVSRKDVDEFLKVIVCLRNRREARLFLGDLLTKNEIDEFASRWHVARMIADGVPYTQIIKATGQSSRTIARVARWVKRGTGGFRMLMGRTRR